VAFTTERFAFVDLPGTVLDGRDIGTVVCPGATAKLFVTADVAIRATRRYKELLEREELRKQQQQQQQQAALTARHHSPHQKLEGLIAESEAATIISYERVLQEMQARDARDVGRAAAPCVPAADALVLDTTRLGIDEVFKAAVLFIEKNLRHT
jgi:cytidylate kinase